MIKVTVNNGDLNQREIDAYLDYGTKKYPTRIISEIKINVDGDFVDLQYSFMPQPFQRIRRITGYLVGTVDRFNNAKRAEERERVKHSV